MDRRQEAMRWLREQLAWEARLEELRRLHSQEMARDVESNERAAA